MPYARPADTRRRVADRRMLLSHQLVIEPMNGFLTNAGIQMLA